MFTVLRSILADRTVRWSVGFLLLVALIALSLIVKRDYFSELAEGNSRYLSVLYNVQFDVPADYTVEDIARTDAILLYPVSNDALTTDQTEEEFLKSGGIFVRSLREIPGTRQIFELFQTNEFEKKLSELDKEFRSERAVTEQGFDAFKVLVTAPSSEVHVVIDSPIAYWLMAGADTPNVRTIYNSLTTVKPDETAEIKRPVADFENFLTDIRNAKIDDAYAALTTKLQSTLTQEAFGKQVKPFGARLDRSMQLISVRSDGTTAFLRYTLEDTEANVYSFLGAELNLVKNNWEIQSFVIDKDRPGNPSEEIIKRVKKELKKDDLLGGRTGGR